MSSKIEKFTKKYNFSKNKNFNLKNKNLFTKNRIDIILIINKQKIIDVINFWIIKSKNQNEEKYFKSRVIIMAGGKGTVIILKFYQTFITNQK